MNPATLASLAYDAVSLVALLAPGKPYSRFTNAALMDPNGFSGVNGIFRFNPDGTSERGLAVLEMATTGPIVSIPRRRRFRSKACKNSHHGPGLTRPSMDGRLKAAHGEFDFSSPAPLSPR